MHTLCIAGTAGLGERDHAAETTRPTRKHPMPLSKWGDNLMTSNLTESQDAAGPSAAASASTSQPLDQLLNQEINISNYMDYAQNFSYADSGLQSSIGLTPLVVNGQVVQVYDTKNGVQAEAFITTGSGSKHIVVGYAGTGIDFASGTASFYSSPNSTTGSAGNLFTGAQLQDEVAILAGQTPKGAAASATAFANEVANDAAALGIDKSDVFLTGHNLGGTLAEYAASKTGLGGTTFGAAGITQVGSKKVTNFTNIVTTGDAIGNYATNGSNPLGPIVLSPNIKHYGSEKLIGPESQLMTLRANAANAYATHDFTQIGNFLQTGILYNSLQAYGQYLGGKVNLSYFGSFANPTAPSSSQSTAGASAPASATVTHSAPPSVAATAASAATTSVPPPSSQVANQDINICNYMYNARTVPFSASSLSQLGLKPLKYKGHIVQVYNQKAGVFGEAFETTGTSSPQVIVAFQGTDPYGLGNTNTFTGGQLLDDASFFAGKPAACAAAAGNFANKVVDIAGKLGIAKGQVSLTGHSLGAAEAEYAAEATGLGGVTFGTPGIDISGTLPASALTNFVDMGDPVGNYGTDGANPLGDFVTSPTISHYGGVTLIGTPEAAQAQANLVSTTQDFFDQTADGGQYYKDFLHAAENLGADFEYHHLSEYAASLNNFYGSDVIKLLCFAAGTRIRTVRGDVPVETLAVGNRVVTASGGERRVTWTGRRTLRPDAEAWPVRILAGAFGAGLPERDLCLSPGHPVLVGADEDGEGGHLVPVMCLINGTTIEREPRETVTYWHVELDAHDILLAEGLPAESYIDLGSRPWFDGVDGVLHDPDMAASGMPGRCRPVATDGPVVEAERRRLDAVLAVRLTAAAGWLGEADAMGF